MDITREKMNYDLLIVGAGPSGLSAAINFKKLCKKYNKDFSVCVVEKGSEVGAHILSGAILEPTALNELCNNWQGDDSCPVKVKVKDVREIFERSILKDEVIKRLVADKNLWSESEKRRKRL